MKTFARLSVFLLVVASSLASAQKATTIEDAMKMRNAGRFEDARRALLELRAVQDSPRLEVELGLTWMALGKYAQAEAELRSALGSRADSHVMAHRREIELALGFAERHIGTVEIVTNAPRVTVATDRGDVVLEGGRGPVRLDEGSQKVTVNAEGFEPAARDVLVRARESIALELTLAREHAEPASRCAREGMTLAEDGVTCCWPGQTIDPDGTRCTGIPTCPGELVAAGFECIGEDELRSMEPTSVPVGGIFVLNGTYSRFIDGSVRMFRETTNALTDAEAVDAVDHLFGFQLRAGYRFVPAFGLSFSLRGMAARNVTWLESDRGASAATRDDIDWTAYAHESGLMFEFHTSRTRRRGMIDVSFATGPHYARLWMVPDTDRTFYVNQDVSSLEAITIPMDLAVSFFVSRGFAFNLFGGVTPWIPLTYRGEIPETQVNYELSRSSLRTEWSYTAGVGFTVMGGRPSSGR